MGSSGVMFWLRSDTVLGHVVVIFFSSTVVLRPNGNFWVVPLLHSVSNIVSAYRMSGAHLPQQCHNTTVSQHNIVTTQQCHDTTVSRHNSVTTQKCHNTTVSRHNNVTTQQCHNTTVSRHNSVTTQQCHDTTVSQHNSVTTQQCLNSECVIFQERLLNVLKCYNFLWLQDDATALQRRVLQTALWHYTC